MSDEADVFYSTWCVSFNNPYMRLHCLWHVERNWKNKKKYPVNNDDSIKTNFYALLKFLHTEEDEKKKFKLQTCLRYSVF